MASGPKVRSREGGKKPHVERPTSKKWKVFEINGDSFTRKLKTCPKCSGGVYLANHANRESCGKCGYTQFKNMKKIQTETKKGITNTNK